MNTKDKVWFPVLYMFLLTLVLSTILIVFGTITRKRVKENEAIAFERAVIQSLQIDVAEATPAQIHRIYLSSILEADETSGGALRYVRGDSLKGYALPVEGPGFWAAIKGVIGLCDFFIGSRMHACIAALSQGIPTVAVAYSPKFKGVFDSIGTGDMVIDATSVDMETAIEAICNHFQKYEHLKIVLKDTVETAKSELFERFREILMPRMRFCD